MTLCNFKNVKISTFLAKYLSDVIKTITFAAVLDS